MANTRSEHPEAGTVKLFLDPEMQRFRHHVPNSEIQQIVATALKNQGIDLTGALWCWFNRGDGPELVLVRAAGDS